MIKDRNTHSTYNDAMVKNVYFEGEGLCLFTSHYQCPHCSMMFTRHSNECSLLPEVLETQMTVFALPVRETDDGSRDVDRVCA